MKRTALLSIAAAAALVALKLGAGMAVGSLGLISAGIESTGDVVAAVMTLLGYGSPASRLTATITTATVARRTWRH